MRGEHINNVPSNAPLRLFLIDFDFGLLVTDKSKSFRFLQNGTKQTNLKKNNYKNNFFCFQFTLLKQCFISLLYGLLAKLLENDGVQSY